MPTLNPPKKIPTPISPEATKAKTISNTSERSLVLYAPW